MEGRMSEGKKKHLYRILVCFAAVLLPGALILWFCFGHAGEKDRKAKETQTPEVTEESIVVSGLEKEYSFLFVTDSHMVVKDETDSEEIKEYADSRYPQFRDAQGTASAELFAELVDYANEEKTDALLLGGDMIDYPSEANVEYLGEQLGELEVKYLYTPGNHDWTYPWEYMTPYGRETYRSMLEPYMQEEPAIHQIEYEDVILVAVDNSTNQIDPDALTLYQKILKKGKPVLLMLHVPLLTQSVLTKAKEAWSSPVVLGGGNYGGIYPDETSTKFIELTTAENSPVVAVLAGHVHFADRDQINERIVQIVGAPGYQGKVTRIRLVPALVEG